MKEDRPIVVVDTHRTPTGRECLSIQWGSLPVGDDFERYSTLMLKEWHRFIKAVGWPSHFLTAVVKACELEGFDVRWTKQAIREVKARYKAREAEKKNPSNGVRPPGRGGDVCVGQRPETKVRPIGSAVKGRRLSKSRTDA